MWSEENILYQEVKNVRFGYASPNQQLFLCLYLTGIILEIKI